MVKGNINIVVLNAERITEEDMIIARHVEHKWMVTRMDKIKRAFTKWYIRKGYTFGHEFTCPWRAYWKCPCWVRPLLFLFSPSEYALEAWGKSFVEGFERGANY